MDEETAKAADDFIRRAHEVFPGSVELDRNSQPTTADDQGPALGPEDRSELHDYTAHALPGPRCKGIGHETQPLRDEYGDWRCRPCGKPCDPPGSTP
jgi:hypothetical protein